MRTKMLVIGAALAMMIAACGGDTGSSPTPKVAADSASPSNRTAGAATTVSVADSPLGVILTDGQGQTLYLFEQDAGPESTCYQVCAANWPAFLSDGTPQIGAGADASLVGTTTRTDGGNQVTYAGHPLYYFAGDQAVGDTNGEGIGDTWYIVAPDGTKIERPGDAGSAY
jgi:predicted lipoprotein with Yx(FWY)xxD motif